MGKKVADSLVWLTRLSYTLALLGNYITGIFNTRLTQPVQLSRT